MCQCINLFYLPICLLNRYVSQKITSDDYIEKIRYNSHRNEQNGYSKNIQPTANQERSSKSYVRTYLRTYIRAYLSVSTYLYIRIPCIPFLQQRTFVRRKNNIKRTNLKQMYEMLA